MISAYTDLYYLIVEGIVIVAIWIIVIIAIYKQSD